MSIPVYTLFDAEAGFEARSNKSQDKIEEERTNHIVGNRKVLKYFGLEEEDFPNSTITENVAMFADDLESYLAEYWPEWINACKEVELNAGISLRKNQLAYRSATLKAAGEIPGMLVNILAKAKGN